MPPIFILFSGEILLFLSSVGVKNKSKFEFSEYNINEIPETENKKTNRIL